MLTLVLPVLATLARLGPNVLALQAQSLESRVDGQVRNLGAWPEGTTCPDFSHENENSVVIECCYYIRNYSMWLSQDVEHVVMWLNYLNRGEADELSVLEAKRTLVRNFAFLILEAGYTRSYIDNAKALAAHLTSWGCDLCNNAEQLKQPNASWNYCQYEINSISASKLDTCLDSLPVWLKEVTLSSSANGKWATCQGDTLSFQSMLSRDSNGDWSLNPNCNFEKFSSTPSDPLGYVTFSHLLSPSLSFSHLPSPSLSFSSSPASPSLSLPLLLILSPLPFSGSRPPFPASTRTSAATTPTMMPPRPPPPRRRPPPPGGPSCMYPAPPLRLPPS